MDGIITEDTFTGDTEANPIGRIRSDTLLRGNLTQTLDKTCSTQDTSTHEHINTRSLFRFVHCLCVYTKATDMHARTPWDAAADDVASPRRHANRNQYNTRSCGHRTRDVAHSHTNTLRSTHTHTHTRVHTRSHKRRMVRWKTSGGFVAVRTLGSRVDFFSKRLACVASTRHEDADGLHKQSRQTMSRTQPHGYVYQYV